MIRLDSSKILIPNDVLTDVNPDLFIHSNKADSNGFKVSDKYECTRTPVKGFKSAIIDNKTNTTTIEVSAKILGSQYFEGINKNTIETLIDTVNTSGIIGINKGAFLDTAQILRADVTDNIKPEIITETFYKTLASLPIAQKYNTTLYNTKLNLGVTYNGKQKTVRDRIIFYDKTKDLIRDKELKGLPYANKLYKDFKGVVRVESNHSQFKGLNKIFGNRSLTTVLQSDTKVNHDIFSRITDKSKDIDLRLFNQFEGMKFGTIRNYLGDKGIIELCNYDWHQIELFIKVYNTNNYRHYKKTIRQVYNSLNQQTNGTDINIINHIKQLLYAA